MAKEILLLVVLSSIALAVNGTQSAAQDAAPPAQTGQVGRYQLAVSEGRIYVLDTVTGQCWSRTPNSDWRSDGNPAHAKDGEQPGTSDKVRNLELPAPAVEMTVTQREERTIPGSHGTVRIRLGDITEGQALLAVVTADGDFLLERTSVAQGDKVEFAVAKKRYVLRINELRNILIGDDFAKLTIAEAPAKEASDKPSSADKDQ